MVSSNGRLGSLLARGPRKGGGRVDQDWHVDERRVPGGSRGGTRMDGRPVECAGTQKGGGLVVGGRAVDPGTEDGWRARGRRSRAGAGGRVDKGQWRGRKMGTWMMHRRRARGRMTLGGSVDRGRAVCTWTEATWPAPGSLTPLPQSERSVWAIPKPRRTRAPFWAPGHPGRERSEAHPDNLRSNTGCLRGQVRPGEKSLRDPRGGRNHKLSLAQVRSPWDNQENRNGK